MKPFFQYLPITFLAVALLGTTSSSLHAQTSGFAKNTNRLYNTDQPISVPGLAGDPQSEAIIFYSGHVSNHSNAPANGTAPDSYKLVQSAIGFPVVGGLQADFDFGEEIPPPEAADRNRPPDINPGNAFYVLDTDDNGFLIGRVYAINPGYVTITWKDENNDSLDPIQYLIGNQPARTPVGLYHTHNPDADLSDSIPPPPQTGAPAVDLSSIEEVVFHWNVTIPATGENDNPYLVRNSSSQLYARKKTGLIVLEYRQNDQFIGIEIVELRSSRQPNGPPTAVSIGDQLLPFDENTDLSQLPSPFIAKGLNEGLVYQHNQGIEQLNHLFSISYVEDSRELEIYWQESGTENIIWPYELHRYTASWPKDDPNKYQIYVRGSSENDHGTEVLLPTELNVELMPFQEPELHAQNITNNTFSTELAGTGFTEGWSLLKYQPDNDVRFQVVRSIFHDNPVVIEPIVNWTIGKVINEISPVHYKTAAPGNRGGYIYVNPDNNAYNPNDSSSKYLDRGDRYQPSIYAESGQIFAVNTGNLEVWWSELSSGSPVVSSEELTVQWPATVKTYNNIWPTTTDPQIIIARQNGTGVIDDFNYSLYYQNDPLQEGFNPNDEHAWIVPFGGGEAIVALRDDFYNASNDTSEPYVLMPYQLAEGGDWALKIFQVVATGTADGKSYDFGDWLHTTNDPYEGIAGKKIDAPFPLDKLPYSPENTYVDGPGWEDRNGNHWARAAGDDGVSTENIVMHYYYPVQEDFYFPDSLYPPDENGLETKPQLGDQVPLLDQDASTTPGTPIDVTYTIRWPDSVPTLQTGETLTKAKFGLPGIQGQCSVDVIYQQESSELDPAVQSVRLIDPLRERIYSLISLPTTIATEYAAGRLLFPELPPHLRQRLSYDPVNRQLGFKGVLIEPAAGQPYLLPNVMTQRDEAIMSQVLPELATEIAAFAGQIRETIEVAPEDNDFDSLALTAGFASGSGYVTLAFQNSTETCSLSSPISLEIIKVVDDLYQGNIRVIEADCPFDEKLTLRFDGDLAGQADQFVFEWQTVPDSSGVPPAIDESSDDPGSDWQNYTPQNAGDIDAQSGAGSIDITIKGPGILTLSDNWFICRYRRSSADENDPASWSDWTPAQLGEGWIKRVLAGINPYEQRFKDLGSTTRTINTQITMLNQAGPRWEGSVPLNCGTVDDFGLIEIYETVLKRGIELSIEASNPVDYQPVNRALLLVAGRISDLYIVLGNEAFADAADPTIGVGLNPSEAYLSTTSSMHAFMNQTPSLLEEELNLLRGRDDNMAPGVQVPPFYNRMIWNFSGGLGEVAYALNYDIFDVDGAIDGSLNEVDAKKLYPQGHGDAWGHYLSSIKNYYRLLNHPNYTWIPSAEAVLIGGVPVTVDFLDERKFARAAAAKARSGEQIVNLTYRYHYDEDPETQWQGYKDTDPERNWGLAEWGSRVGQSILVDWIVGNALLPDDYRGSVMLSEDSFQELGKDWTYLLTDDDINIADENISVIEERALDLSLGDFEQLEALKYEPYTGRAAFIAAIDTSIGSTARTRYQTLILGEAQETPEIPETVVYKVENTLKNLRFDDLPTLQAELKKLLGTTQYNLYGSTIESFAEDTTNETAEGFERVDRSTVVELREVAASLQEVQTEINNADRGLNPLGLVKNALPFDIDPAGIDQGRTHFEQIYERAVQAMNNAIGVFNHANESSQILRRQADTINDFENAVLDREADFRSRLVEIFGYPYADDIGGGGTYPAGYIGPDIYHFTYVDPSEILGKDEYANKAKTIEFTANFEDLDFDANGNLTETPKTVTYNLSTNGFGLVKPESWTGVRRAPGEIQLARSDLMQTNARFQRTLKDYDNLIEQIEDQVELLAVQKGVDTEEIRLYNADKDKQVSLNKRILGFRGTQLLFGDLFQKALLNANALAEAFPKTFGLANDATAPARSGAKKAGIVAGFIASATVNTAALGELSQQQAKEITQANTNINVITNRQDLGIEQQLKQIEQLIRQEAVLRLDLYALEEALQQSSGRYLASLSRGERLLEDRLRFRQQTAATIQEHRYKDMAFRIFRNDALQKYRAQYDLAAKYVYLAARAYDYETNMLDTDSQGPGKDFLTDIVRSRHLGIIQNGGPQTAGVEGDPGLADPMARMSLNWNLVIKNQLGFNNPQREVNDFSLRRELFRIPAGAAYDEVWRETLERHLVDNVLDHPAFQRYARPFNPTLPNEPALVIPFPTTIQFGLNAFGWPLGGLDSSYDSSQFATKIRGAGVWLSNYNPLQLSNTPRVYLLPIGNDIMRTPTDDGKSIREWTLYDQKIPVPFPISEGDFADPEWIPINDSVSGSFADLRKFSSFRAYHGVYDESNIINDSRLIGRSVWNTQWVLIIPAGTLLNDRDEGLTRLIHGSDQFGQRDGNGIKDIVLYFNTYSYSGN